MTTAGILLAAGGGTRYLGPTHKLLADFRGRPLAAWAIDALLGSGLDEVAVVIGAVDLAPVVEGRCALLMNSNWAAGQATSLAVAVDWASSRGHSGVVIGLGDQPLVSSAAWSTVAGETRTPICTASFAGQRRPPVHLDAAVWPLLPRDGDEGARLVMASRPELVTVVECPGEPLDIDTVGDLDGFTG